MNSLMSYDVFQLVRLVFAVYATNPWTFPVLCEHCKIICKKKKWRLH